MGSGSSKPEASAGSKHVFSRWVDSCIVVSVVVYLCDWMCLGISGASSAVLLEMKREGCSGDLRREGERGRQRDGWTDGQTDRQSGKLTKIQ